MCVQVLLYGFLTHSVKRWEMKLCLIYSLQILSSTIFATIYPSLALQRCKGIPLSPLGKKGAGPTGLWGVLSLEPPELRCFEFDLP